jgi:hypothetical protein
MRRLLPGGAGGFGKALVGYRKASPYSRGPGPGGDPRPDRARLGGEEPSEPFATQGALGFLSTLTSGNDALTRLP